MKRLLCIALLLVAGAAQGLPAAPASAQGGVLVAADGGADTALARDDGISLEEAVKRVRRQYGGRIVSAETRGSGDRRVHVIKVLTKDGRVRTVRIRAN